MTKRNIDILLLARPDHSLNIYKSLCSQNKLSFHFLTFRVLSKIWRFLGLHRVLYVDRNVSILKVLTFRHILKYKFHRFIDLNETKYFERGVESILSKFSPRIIHYWPSYCHNVVARYKSLHPDVITIAEQYMPNPIYVMKCMQPVYERYGLRFNNAYLEKYSHQILKHFEGADYIAVPSKFVEETMKLTFPNHKYIRIPYGITKSNLYSFETKAKQIQNFVYVGGVSLEKGVDIILKYFCNHKGFQLHLYGELKEIQKDVFDPYMKCSNIHFHGSVSKDVLQRAFCKMDVAIHPSRFDAYSLAVGEEIGAGLPVIVSDKTGIKDDVKSNGWGIVFSSDDLVSLDKAILKIIDINNYNIYKKNINKYLNDGLKSYGEDMIEIYLKMLLK